LIAVLIGGSLASGALACTGGSPLQLQVTAPCPAPLVDTSDWRLVESTAVSLRLPPGFRARDVQAIDSRAFSYESADGQTTVNVDYGYGADPLGEREEWLSYARCNEEIGGRTATVISAQSRYADDQSAFGQLVAGATWRDVEPGVSLTVIGYTSDSTRQARLLAVLRTVEFIDRPG